MNLDVMMNDKIKQQEPQKVEEMICFALYSATTAINKAYAPLLSKIGLTYPQYITLSALSQQAGQTGAVKDDHDKDDHGKDEKGVTVGWLCNKLMTDTNTMTPILKRLEAAGHITRQRGENDKRQVLIALTLQGARLQTEQCEITKCVVSETAMPEPELEKLVGLISQMRDNLAASNAANNQI